MPTVKPEDPASIYVDYKPNAVQAKCYSHNDLAIVANAVGTALHLEPGDRICLSYPLYSDLGHAIGIWAPYTYGAFVVLPSQFFDAEKHLEAIPVEHCNTLIASVDHADAMFKNPHFKALSFQKIKKALIVSSTPVPEELLKQFQTLNIAVSTLNTTEIVKGVNLKPLKKGKF